MYVAFRMCAFKCLHVCMCRTRCSLTNAQAHFIAMFACIFFCGIRPYAWCIPDSCLFPFITLPSELLMFTLHTLSYSGVEAHVAIHATCLWTCVCSVQLGIGIDMDEGTTAFNKRVVQWMTTPDVRTRQMKLHQAIIPRLDVASRNKQDKQIK